MFRKIKWSYTLRTSVIAAILFCIPAAIYINAAQYRGSWLLYLGNFLFMSAIWVHTLAENKLRGENESTVALVFISHVSTIMGILLSCIICFILLSVMVPGYLGQGMTDKSLSGEPAGMVVDKTGGLSLEVFMAATIINFSVGSFTGIILSFYSKKNQTKDGRDPAPLHQGGKK